MSARSAPVPVPDRRRRALLLLLLLLLLLGARNWLLVGAALPRYDGGGVGYCMACHGAGFRLLMQAQP